MVFRGECESITNLSGNESVSQRNSAEQFGGQEALACALVESGNVRVLEMLRWRALGALGVYQTANQRADQATKQPAGHRCAIARAQSEECGLGKKNLSGGAIAVDFY